MANLDRIWQINSFNGGESDDLIQGPANSFYSGENIEIRKSLTALQLAQLVEDTGWVFDDDISYMVSLETLGVKSGGVIVCLENGKIYLDGVLRQTLNTGTNAFNQVYGIGVNEDLTGTQYVYFITTTTFGTGKIHRSTTNLGTFNISYREYIVSSTGATFVGVINETGLLYIATGNKVFLMEFDEIVQEYLTLPSQEEIMGFTQFQGQYTIYTNLVNTGIQYKWDGVSEATTYRQEWENMPILGVVNDGSKDYAVLGFNENYSDLYEIQGTQKAKIRTNLATSSNSRILNGYLSIRKGIIYISGGLTGESSNYGVYTYGNYYPGATRSLVQSFSGTSKFLYHCHVAETSYLASTDNKVYKITHNNPPAKYAASGYAVANIYQGFRWEEKTFNYMKIGFKLNGGEIKIYARAEMGDAWKLIKTIDNANYGDKRSLRLDKNELMTNSVSLGTFNEIQLKFALTPSDGGLNTPEVYAPTTWLLATNTN